MWDYLLGIGFCCWLGALCLQNRPPGCLVMPDFGGSAGLERAEMSGEGGAAYEGGSVAGVLGR